MQKLVFGVSLTDSSSERLNAVNVFLAELGRRSNVTIEPFAAPSYEALATAVREDALELAWLPPIVFLRTDAHKAKQLVAIRRGQENFFHAVLVVREDSTYKKAEDLVGARAAWIDPWSASGFIIPRLSLMSKGIDPRAAFRAESFKWSHKAAVQAVVEGSADVCGTYAHVDERGTIESGGWETVKNANVRVLESLGRVPPDLICHAARLAPEVTSALRDVLTSATPDDDLGKAAVTLFQSSQFLVTGDNDYDTLRRDLQQAEEKKLFTS